MLINIMYSDQLACYYLKLAMNLPHVIIILDYVSIKPDSEHLKQMESVCAD